MKYNHAVTISFSFDTPHEDPNAVENAPFIREAVKMRLQDIPLESDESLVDAIECYDTYVIEEKA